MRGWIRGFALAWVVAGCADSAGDDASDEASDDDTAPPEVESVEIAGELELASTCVDLVSGERVASIGPEGHVWLAPGPGASATYRVVDGEGSSSEVELAESAEFVWAWDASRVSYVAGGQLWQADLSDGATEPLFWPGVDAPSWFCGDPTLDGDGFVVAGSGLLQRDAGLWWRWRTPSGDDFGPIAALGTSYGACIDRQGALWLASEAGEVWRVHSDDARAVSQLAGASRLVFDASFGSAGLIGETLVYGSLASDTDEDSGWVEPRIPTRAGEPAPVTAIAASSGTLWVASAERLLAFDGAQWLEVLADGEPVVGLAADQVWADSSAAWVERDGQLCRLAAAPQVELDGIRPLMRVQQSMLGFEVLGAGAAAAANLRVVLDGTLVAESEAAELPWQVAEFALGEPGWHVIEIETAVGTPARRVEIELRQLEPGTWVDDIAPLAELHCTAINGCHDAASAGDKPELSDYEGWVMSADAIRARVGLTGDMPPAAVRLESWDAEEVALILTWIDAGMPIGQAGP